MFWFFNSTLVGVTDSKVYEMRSPISIFLIIKRAYHAIFSYYANYLATGMLRILRTMQVALYCILRSALASDLSFIISFHSTSY